MLNTISATELTHNTKTVIQQVVTGRQPMVVLNYREPVAVIVDYSSWQLLTQKRTPELDTLKQYMEKGGKRTDLTKVIRKMRDAE